MFSDLFNDKERFAESWVTLKTLLSIESLDFMEWSNNVEYSIHFSHTKHKFVRQNPKVWKLWRLVAGCHNGIPMSQPLKSDI